MKRTAIITGASRGIGAAIALHLAQNDYDLFLCGNHSSEQLEKITNKCRHYGARCQCFLGDLSKSETATQIGENAFAFLGHIDVLINNAGMADIGLITDVTDEKWFQLLNTNLSSAFFLCRQVLPHMIHEKQGRIINISSIWGCLGASCEAAYSATKGGLNSLTKALAKELAPSGISVNAVACGMIDTEMNACFSSDDTQEICQEIPIGRMASPEETAEFIALLLQAPHYLTGQVIGFDGGWS
nr:SDR family NAD(P)-dependent oxidoreductase [Eubacterium sp.]